MLLYAFSKDAAADNGQLPRVTKPKLMPRTRHKKVMTVTFSLMVTSNLTAAAHLADGQKGRRLLE